MTSAAALATEPVSARPCLVCARTGHVRFRQEGGYEIRQCTSCGLRFLHPQPTPAELDAFYAEHYFKSGDSVSTGYDGYADEAANWRATFRDRLKHLPQPSPNQRLLDVGAAAGYFVEQARAFGWDAEGIEPSKWAASYARDRLGQPVREGTLESAAYPTASFDVVTLWEVIEHLADPRAFLAEVARVLKPGGMIALSTPDAGSTAARLSGNRWLGWRKIPEHLFFFDRPALTRLFDQAGFDVIDHRYVTLTVTWGFALQRLGALVGVPALGKVPGWIGDRNVRINCFYDLMMIGKLRERRG